MLNRGWPATSSAESKPLPRVNTLLFLLDEPVDQLPGYCNPGGDGGKIVGGKPAGFFNFGGVGFNFTTGVIGQERYHQ